MPLLAFRESWTEGPRWTPGMSEALIEMVLSFFAPSGRVTCKLAPVLLGAAITKSKSHAILRAASLATARMIVMASVCFAFGVYRWETIGAVMGWARPSPSHRGSSRTSLSSGFLYAFGSGPESMHAWASLSHPSPYWTMVFAAESMNPGQCRRKKPKCVAQE